MLVSKQEALALGIVSPFGDPDASKVDHALATFVFHDRVPVADARVAESLEPRVVAPQTATAIGDIALA